MNDIFPGAYLRLALFVVMLIALLGLETAFPLRRRVENRLRRFARNMTIAAIASGAMRLTFLPSVAVFAALAQERRWGLLHLLPAGSLPTIAKVALSLLALDYTIYLWHVANHRIRFLWRFHLVHHIDRDMDVSTASRFHFGELMLSVFYRCCQIALIGVDPFSVMLFEMLVVTSAQFHHSNLRLPEGVDRGLRWLVVTPRMHGVHHSSYQPETDSNFSTIFSFWDRLHRTMKWKPNESLTIGIAGYLESEKVTLGKALLLPFRRRV